MALSALLHHGPGQDYASVRRSHYVGMMSDVQGREIHVEHTVSDGEISSTKSKRSRPVDMSSALRDLLLQFHKDRLEEKLARGWEEMPPWVFVTRAGTRNGTEPRRQSVQESIEGSGTSPSFQPAQLAPHVRVTALTAGREPGLCTTPTRPCVDPTHGRTPTGGGYPWATRQLWIDSMTTEVVAEW